MSEYFLKSEEIKTMIDEIKKHDLISLDEMPEYDLLISQIVDFFNKEHPINEDYTITKNMLQNYIRDDIMLKPVEGKKKGYNKNHLIFISLIRNIKSVIQTSKIKKIFKPIFKDMSTTEDDVVPLSDVYSAFLTLNNKTLDFYSKNMDIDYETISKYLPETLAEEDKKNAALFLAVLNLLAQASAHKRLAEKIIEKYF